MKRSKESTRKEYYKKLTAPATRSRKKRRGAEASVSKTRRLPSRQCETQGRRETHEQCRVQSTRIPKTRQTARKSVQVKR